MTAVALFTVFHPAIAAFLEPFAHSLRAQEDRAVELWVALDGISPAHASAIVQGAGTPHWIGAEAGETPARLRQRAFASLCEGYEAIVFVDADDVLLPDRIGAARRALERHDVSVCGMQLIDAGGADLRLTFRPDPEAVGPERLARRNVVGLSNSAYRAELLRRCLPIPDDCVLVDWLLATRARALEARFDLDPEPRMAYRQHASNVARLLPPFDAAALDRAAALIQAHHRLLLASAPPLGDASREAIVAAARRLELFGAAIAREPSMKSAYLAAVNEQPHHPGAWWEWVADPRLESLWKTS